jgi:hypothetical protein
MSRTGLDAATLARSLRDRAGDGSIDWVNQPFQAAALLDIADMLDENAKLRELVRDIADHIKYDDGFGIDRGWMLDRMAELGIEVPE